MNQPAKHMQAILCHAYGDAEVMALGNQPIPKPNKKQVLIKVEYSSVSSGDARIRRADPCLIRLIFGLFKPRQKILGGDCSGEIVQLGADVTEFKLGDKVLACSGPSFGGNAQYMVIDAQQAIVVLPAGISTEQAIALPFGGAAALYFLQDLANIQAGQRLLVNGASGAIGVMAVQLAKYFSAHVTALCSEKNHRLVTELGADKCIDYHQHDIYQMNEKYDVILDTQGNLGFSRSKKILNHNGKFLAVVAGLMAFLNMPLNRFRAHKILPGVALERKKDLITLLELYQRGVIKPVIDQQVSLAQVPQMHAYVDQGHKKGTIIVKVA